MPSLKIGGIFEATIDRISNSGNAVIEGDSTGSIALIKSGSWAEGDTVTVKITAHNGSTYTAVPMYKETGASTPPLHHDGSSAGQTRSMNEAFASVEERTFDPKTHGAPELEKDHVPPTIRKSSQPKSEKSLREIAQELDEAEFTEKQKSA